MLELSIFLRQLDSGSPGLFILSVPLHFLNRSLITQAAVCKPMDRTPRCVIQSSRIVQSGPSGWFETASIVDRRQLSSEMPREHKSIFKNVIFEGLEILPELSVDHSHIFARRTAQSEI